jgi:hypothetical protein
VIRPGVVMRLRVGVFVVMVVLVAVAGQLQSHKTHARGDEHAAHDRVLSVLDGRAELEPDHDDHTAQDD